MGDEGGRLQPRLKAGQCLAVIRYHKGECAARTYRDWEATGAWLGQGKVKAAPLLFALGDWFCLGGQYLRVVLPPWLSTRTMRRVWVWRRVRRSDEGAWRQDYLRAGYCLRWSSGAIEALFPFLLASKWGQVEIVVRAQENIDASSVR